MTEDKFVIHDGWFLGPGMDDPDSPIHRVPFAGLNHERLKAMENPAGPVISETMIESRVKAHQESAERRVGQILEGVGDQVNVTINQLIYEAYTKGLADGFAQRVFADGPKLEVE